ncbi:MAG: hypothetical protein H0X62_02605 [Bacteroidetes bacterium]|nr:hypothetical protein [Bacteroidota bacterium]
MRVIAEIPHELFKISIFSWNGKFIIKIELDQFEQSFKIKEDDVSGLEDVKKIVDEEFLDVAFQNFLGMRKGFADAFNRMQHNF